MSFILVPKRGDDVQVNGWNWRPTLELLLREGLISEELHERMGTQGAGGEVDEELAGRMAEAVERSLEAMKPGERMRADLTVTDRAKPTFSFGLGTRPDETDVNELYSATYDWLAKFAAFCSRSGGFEVC